MFWTNRGKFLLLDWVFHAETMPDTFYVVLITGDNVPTVDTNTLSELTEIVEGNGYTTGGYELFVDSSAPDFDVFTEDDVNDRALVQLKDIIWTASGGIIPPSGNGARYAVLTDGDGSSGEDMDIRQVIAVWDLLWSREVTDGLALTLANCELQAVEPS